MTKDENGRFVHNSGKRVLVGENSFNDYVLKADSDKNYSVYFRKNDKDLIIKKEEYSQLDSNLLNNGYVKYFSYRDSKLVENTYTEKKFIELYKSESLDFSDEKIYEKNFNDTVRVKSLLVNRKYEAIVNGEKKTYSMELTTTGAGTYLKELFNTSDSLFTAPKNVGYLKLLTTLFKTEPFFVLDFFSGSGSCADAVMQLNAEDRGNRKFIMVQLPEKINKTHAAYKAGYKTIAEISKERIRRAAAKIQAENPGYQGDLGFKVFKLDSTNIKPWELDFDLTEQDLEDQISNIKPDRKDDDVLYEVLLKYGLDLTLPITEHSIDGHKVFNIGMGALIVCLSDNISLEVAEGIAKLKDELNPEIMRVVFKDAGFADDVVKTNALQILKQAGIEDVRSL